MRKKSFIFIRLKNAFVWLPAIFIKEKEIRYFFLLVVNSFFWLIIPHTKRVALGFGESPTALFLPLLSLLFLSSLSTVKLMVEA